MFGISSLQFLNLWDITLELNLECLQINEAGRMERTCTKAEVTSILLLWCAPPFYPRVPRLSSRVFFCRNLFTSIFSRFSCFPFSNTVRFFGYYLWHKWAKNVPMEFLATFQQSSIKDSFFSLILLSPHSNSASMQFRNLIEWVAPRD